jgi:ABC-type antimicrobial peptide transport system permease subunit
MGRGTDNGVRGIYRTATSEPIPVLANTLFMAATNARQGEPFVTSVGGAYAPVVIVGTVSYFPTLDPAREPFLIADVDSLTEFLELRGLSEYKANEVFIDLVSDGVDAGAAASVRSLFPGGNIADRAVLLNDSVIDPLAVAGWRGIGVVAVGIAAVSAVLGYVTYLSAHARRTRTDAAYMRSLGFSRSAYMRMALIEHSIVGAIGIGLGIASGLVVSGLAADSISHTATGRDLLPPFVLQTNWVPVTLLLAAVAAAVSASIAAILRSFARSPIHELVRSPE